MYQALRNKIKHRVQAIKSQKLRDIVILFMQYVNSMVNSSKDFFAIFSNVKLYRKEASLDYDLQWVARLGKATDANPYQNFELYRDPEEIDEKHMRGDDRFILSILPDNTSLLELGCGNGRLGYALKKKKNIEYCGLDISSTAVEHARARGLEAYVCDLNRLEDISKIVGNRHFNYVISVWTLQVLSSQEVLIPGLFKFSDIQLHAVWNAGHWSSRLRLLFGRFPIYSYSGDKQGRIIYPYAYGQYQRHWTYNDFKSYIKELGFKAVPLGVGHKYLIRTAELKRHMFLPSLLSGRILWKITRE